MHFEKYRADSTPTGIKKAHQNKTTAVPIEPAPSIPGENNPSMGRIKQVIKNTPWIRSRAFSHLFGLVCTSIAKPAKNVDSDIKA